MGLRALWSGQWVRAFGFVIVAGVLVCSNSSLMSGKPERTVLRRHHKRADVFRHRDATTTEDYNWSGWAVTGATGSVTDVKSSWVVPTATCTNSSDGQYAAFWLGIDGWTSDTVEQIGTDSDCVSTSGAANTATYYAWFEFYPQDAYYIGNPENNFKGYVVSPGDVISAEVKSSTTTSGGHGFRGHGGGSTSFTVTISDAKQGWSFSTSSSVPGAQQSSAEWIAEAPSGCDVKGGGGYCPLSNFGTVEYGANYTDIASTAYATVNGKTGAIGSFGSAAQEAIMVSYPNGTTTMAEPSGLVASGSSFTDSWFNAGP
jgi:hypothetical protein